MACFDDLSFITQVSTRIITSNEIKLKLIKHGRKMVVCCFVVLFVATLSDFGLYTFLKN